MTAYVTGTATNYLDLLNKLRNFLTSNVTLVAAGEQWAQIAGNTGALVVGDQIVLQGPGTGGTDEVLVGIETSVSVPSDYYNIRFSGFTIWNPASAYRDQVNSTHDYTINLWDQPMKYWFVANGRRFMGVVQVSTVYMSFYCGFILPYVLPSLWPYPLFIGASSRQPTWRYSLVDPNMSAFFDPGETVAGLIFPDVIWRGIVNRYNSGGGGADGSNRQAYNVDPWRWDLTPIRENLDGSYNLDIAVINCDLSSGASYDAQLGILEGVFRVSGFGNSPESIVQEGGVDHIVIPNVFRNTWADFAALALE